MKIISSIILSLFLSITCFGNNTGTGDIQTGDTSSAFSGSIEEEAKCIEKRYDLAGDFNVKTNTPILFSITDNFVWKGKEDKKVTFQIKKDGKSILQKETDKLTTSFPETGFYTIEVLIEEKNSGCIYVIEKEFNIYSKIVSYISEKDDLNIPFDDVFRKNDILFDTNFLGEKSAFPLQEQFLSQITAKLSQFQDSDIIIVNSKSYLEVLQGFEQLSNIYNVDFPNKKIFLITDSSFMFSKSILGNFINTLNISVYTLPTTSLLNFLNHISLGNPSTDTIKDDSFGVKQISFDTSSNSLFFLTQMTNRLIASGIPISILGIILSLSIVVTVINFIRQFLGISIFSLYYPILFALSLSVFRIEFTLILTISSLLALFCVKFLYKKTHFLLNTKLSLFFILYLIFTILIIGSANILISIQLIDIKSTFVLFPFVVIPMIIYRIFGDESKMFNFPFLIHIGEFIFVAFMSYLILQSSFIQSILLAYTEILLIIFILNILIGKFTGLQLLEYLRFFPLLKSNSQEEE